jgi:hypothetical protein
MEIGEMKRTLCIAFVLLAFLSLFLPLSADTGPKPSLHIEVEGLGERVCYGAILTKGNL